MTHIATTPSRNTSTRLSRFALGSSLRATVFGGLAYLVAQPLLVAIFDLSSKRPVGFASAALWARFELTEVGLGSFVGSILYLSLRWPRGSWRRDWAAYAIPGVGFSAAFAAHELVRMSAMRWITLALVSGATSGALLAFFVRAIRRLAGPSVTSDGATDDIALD